MWYVTKEVSRMGDRAQCLIEFARSIKVDPDLPSHFPPFSGIVSKRFGKQPVHSLHSPKDEMDDGLRIGWIHSVIRANGFGIGNSLVHVDLPMLDTVGMTSVLKLLGSSLIKQHML